MNRNGSSVGCGRYENWGWQKWPHSLLVVCDQVDRKLQRMNGVWGKGENLSSFLSLSWSCQLYGWKCFLIFKILIYNLVELSMHRGENTPELFRC